jgi:adenylate kinase
MRLVLLGPPGAGKGTQARFLVETLEVPHISTGEMIRESIRRGEGAGAAARSLVEAGKLVPDNVVLNIVEERLGQEDCGGGFVLDGYPRNVQQARDLDRVLEGMGIGLDAALEFTLDEEVVLQRLGLRRSCASCGRIFHLEFNRPEREGICDGCGSELVQRKDDQEEVIRQRLQVYRETADPLVDYYRERSILRSVSARGAVEEVARQARQALGREA